MSLWPIRDACGTGAYRHGPGWPNPATTSWKLRVHDTSESIWPGVNIDDPPWQEGQNLTALLVEPEHPRNVLKTRGEEAEQGVHCCRPRTSGPKHRAADPPRAAHVASQPRRLFRFAPVAITHV